LDAIDRRWPPGRHFEHTIAITGQRADVLTAAPAAGESLDTAA